jgi:hypothetical protein
LFRYPLVVIIEEEKGETIMFMLIILTIVIPGIFYSFCAAIGFVVLKETFGFFGWLLKTLTEAGFWMVSSIVVSFYAVALALVLTLVDVAAFFARRLGNRIAHSMGV